jgi:hypothetical protein
MAVRANTSVSLLDSYMSGRLSNCNSLVSTRICTALRDAVLAKITGWAVLWQSVP